jgi:hypothetical protein
LSIFMLYGDLAQLCCSACIWQNRNFFQVSTAFANEKSETGKRVMYKQSTRDTATDKEPGRSGVLLTEWLHRLEPWQEFWPPL